VYRGLFAEFLIKRTRLLEVVGIQELVVFLKRGVHRVIQHVCGCSGFASIRKEFTDPEGTEQMGVAGFLGPLHYEPSEIIGVWSGYV